MLIFVSLPAISNIRHSVVRLSVCPWSYTESLWTQYLTNCTWKFNQIYNLGAVEDKGKLIGFWGQKVKARRDQIWSKKHYENFEGHAFKCQGHEQSFWRRHTGHEFTVTEHLVKDNIS